jgi:hypothetical protein
MVDLKRKDNVNWQYKLHRLDMISLMNSNPVRTTHLGHMYPSIHHHVCDLDPTSVQSRSDVLYQDLKTPKSQSLFSLAPISFNVAT